MPPKTPAGASAAPSTITIDVTKDLGKSSDLQSLLTGQGPAVFSIGTELAKFVGEPVEKAVGAKPVGIKFQGEPHWKLPSGIGFTLTSDVNCNVAISRTSTKFSCKKTVDADDNLDVIAGPAPGMVYVNIDLNFDIKGDLSGSGTETGVGISGKASGARTTTFSYCHPVSETTETETAVKSAFDALVFPFKPDCVLRMAPGDVGKVNFDGTLNVELDVTYGFGKHKLSADSVARVRDCVALAKAKLTAPSAEIDTSAKGTFVYKHTDNFDAIVQKVDAGAARLFVTHSGSDETSESAGVNVGIKVNSSSASVNSGKLAAAVGRVVKEAPPKTSPSKLESAMAQAAPQIESTLVSKANKFLTDTDVGLTATLSQHRDRTVLYAFNIDLSSPAKAELAKQSWTFFTGGDLQKAMKIPGFTLQPGSGVIDHLKNSEGIQLHFFNLKLEQITDFFSNSGVKLGPDGSLRFFADIGEEEKFTTQSNSTSATIYFVATGSQEPKTGGPQQVEVDFCVELSETNQAGEATRIANCIDGVGQNAAVKAAKQKMLDFVSKNKSKTLCLVTSFKPSAYGRLSCSAYTSGAHNQPIPPALPQDQDHKNWDAFHNMVLRLMPNEQMLPDMSYLTWQVWNLKMNDDPGADLKPGSGHVPARRMKGDQSANATISMFPNNPPLVQPFLEGSQDFMNLCDDLHTLASIAATVKTPKEWDAMIATITRWVKADTNPDWTKPALGALLELCSRTTSTATFDAQPAKDNSKFTCNVTLT